MTASHDDLQTATSAYGKAAKAKLAAAAVSGQPEDQLRNPVEQYLRALGGAAGVKPADVVLVGETTLSGLQVRPDFAVTVKGVLVGFVEVKAPGKGADPRRFTGGHDKAQWQKLKALPNLLYTDGNEFWLWTDGEVRGSLQRLIGNVETSGTSLAAPPDLPGLIGAFLTWEPQPPSTPAQLALTAARLCHLLRDEVAEQLSVANPILAGLASDWRHLLFPDASDEQFADSYAQAVTFGLLMARVRNIDLTQGVSFAAAKLATQQHSLVGAALRILTDGQLAENALQTSVATLTRTLSVVDWPTLSKGDPDAWLYFYEDFLAEYDPALRRKTGSYYTPVPVVRSMTRLVDEALASRFTLPGGLADPAVTVLDPALGTGTYLLEVVRRIAERISADQGEGAVPAALADTVNRIIGFELQMGPYAVAQLRLLAELTELNVPAAAQAKLRTYVTNTLDDPLVEETTLGTWYEPIAQSRREANKVKASEPVMVVIGNPPYKDKSQGTGGFVEHGAPGRPAPLARFLPDKSLGVGVHVKHLYNPYVYFWRWATNKVFEQHTNADRGIVCFITVAGFVGGPGFAEMRAYLRERADAVYVIDCTPEGHQPPVSSRIFQGVQQPVCVTLALRDGSTGAEPAPVYFRSLTAGPRDEKFAELAALTLHDDDWQRASTSPHAPFWPSAGLAWGSYPALSDLFLYSGSGTMVGRTWPIAPDRQSLSERWTALTHAPQHRKPELLQEHLQDRHVSKKLADNLPGYPVPLSTIGDETGEIPDPVRYAYRSFDRQWIIPDKRLINRPNPTLWRMRGATQIYLTALQAHAPEGVAATFTALVPDLDHYRGSFGGRVWPLWRDAAGTVPNVVPKLLTTLSDRLGESVYGPDVMAYVAAVVAQPGYSEKFAADLAVPGVRVPITADAALFARGVDLGRRVLWLHTYGDRFTDEAAGRPPGPPRLPSAQAPKVLAGHPIPADDQMPNELSYDPDTQTLTIGAGRISPVPSKVWDYHVGSKRILTQWFSYRRQDRERPTMGDRRNSPLSSIQPDHWLPEYTADLIDLLNVLALLVEIEADQVSLLHDVVDAAQITVADLTAAGVLPVPEAVRKAAAKGVSEFEIPSDPDSLFG